MAAFCGTVKSPPRQLRCPPIGGQGFGNCGSRDVADPLTGTPDASDDDGFYILDRRRVHSSIVFWEIYRLQPHG
jgi:hypothetical protein